MSRPIADFIFTHCDINARGGKPVSNSERSDMLRQFCALGLMLALGTSVAIKPTSVVAHGAHNHPQTNPIKRSVIQARIPPVVLVRDDGAKIEISSELERQGPTYLNFIFTSCGSVCPVMSQTFSVLRDRLAADRSNIRMISLSIDPEYDTPPRLAAYRQQFAADSGWRFYTGSLEASAAVQKAFGVLSRDKMSHPVATFYRAAPDRPWVRIDGFASPEQLESEYRSNGGQ
jgi:protein SCO1